VRRALAGICLAALSVPPGASLAAAEADKASSATAGVMDQAARGYVVGGESSSASLGGAIYSLFAAAFDTGAAKPNAYVKLQRAHRDEEAPGLPRNFIALGLLFALVRILVAG
jgi:hypothetical protein